MLGEGTNHGEGATTEFKAALTKNLIESCGFNTVIFEASTYEFTDIHLRRRAGDVISSERLGAAVSGLWANDRAFQPLLHFLTRELNAGRITMTGLDDQLSGRGQAYANDKMIPELTEKLPSDFRNHCRATFRKKIYGGFSADDPYTEQTRLDLKSCLTAIQSAPQIRPDLSVADMTASIDRWLSRDFLSSRTGNAMRDASMYENYAAFHARSEKPRKTIIWGATVHFAKSTETISAFSEGPNFGELLISGSDETPYVLGFSASSGSIRMPGGAHRELGVADSDSLEGRVFAQSDRDIIFVDSGQLQAFGEVKAAALHNKLELKYWSDLMDGVVVFHEQRPSIVEVP